MSEALGGRTVYGLNDADAAGLAEATYGQGRNRDGLIAVITLVPASAPPSSTTAR